MKQLSKFALGFALALGTVPATAYAQATLKPLSDHISNIETRIDAGANDGSLTRAEAGRLRDQLHRIQALRDRYAAKGGNLSSTEYSDIESRLDRLSNDLKTVNNNGTRRKM